MTRTAIRTCILLFSVRQPAPPRDPRTLLALLLLLGTTAASTQGVSGSEEHAAAMMVAGYERYGRSSEVDPVTSGRLLATELSCTACHGTPSALMAKKGPSLEGVRDRVHGSWVRQFLLDPQTAKPGATMPALLKGLPDSIRQEALDAILAYLAESRAKFPELKASGANPLPHEFWDKGEAQRGEALYHAVGCVGCHPPLTELQEEVPLTELEKLVSQLDSEELVEMGLSTATRQVPSIPFPDLQAKYLPRGLTHFLMAPHTVRPSGRMPDFQLGPVDAAHLAAFLRPATHVRPFAVNPGDRQVNEADPTGWPVAATPERIEKGRQWYRKLGCAHCHDHERTKPQATPFSQLEFAARRSCTSKREQPELPHYQLDSTQRKHLQAAAEASASERQKSTSALSSAAEEMLRFNCMACHEREGLGGVGLKRRRFFQTEGDIDLGDEGRLPPPLDHVGRKLKLDWLKKVVSEGTAVRPYLMARMPAFRTAASSIPPLLCESDRHTTDSVPEFPTVTSRRQEQLALAGRELFDAGCVQCHSIRDERLPGVAGVEVAHIGQRIQPDWFREFLRQPGQLKPRTRMPTFFPNGRSSNAEVLDGNVQLQIAALWTYLNNCERYPLPQKILDGKAYDFELVPDEQPIVVRTFMKNVGPVTVAAGFPQKIHYAFDAQEVRLALVWRGRFLDAHGTWFDRFTPPAVPLGEPLAGLPAGVALARLKQADATWPKQDAQQLGYKFQGYRLDSQRVPTFLYQMDRLSIEDRIQATAEGGLQRTLRLTSAPGDDQNQIWWIRILTGNELRQTDHNSWQNESGLTVTVDGLDVSQARRHESGEQLECRIPVVLASPLSISIRYEW